MKATSRPPQTPFARIAELEAALHREQRISAALKDVGVALGTTLDLDQLLELILQKITDLLDADRATLYLLDEAKGELVSRLTVGEEVRSIRIKIGEGIPGAVARSGKTVRVKDAYRDKRFISDWDELTGYRTQSILASPMKNHLGRTIGVVQVLNKRGDREFTANDESLLTSLATQAAVSIDNSRLFLSVIQKNMQLLDTKEQLEHRVRDLKLLFELESTMGRANSDDELLKGVLSEATRACESQAAAALLQNEGSLDLYVWEPQSGPELRHTQVDSGPGLIGKTLLAGEPRLLGVKGKGAPRPYLRDVDEVPFHVLTAVTAPLEGEDGSALGAVALYNKSEGRVFSSEDLELTRLIAANLSTAIRLFRARQMRERQERLSTIGSLLSGVVHDLKTPMAIISGYVQMMAEPVDDSKRREYAALVIKQFEMIGAMQREVLEFARGERRMLLRKVYVAKFFGDLAEQIAREVDGRTIRFQFELEDKGIARFDEAKITRVIHNLVRNAIEAMAGMGGTLGLGITRLKRRGAQGTELCIRVWDTGPGIPKEIEKRLFQSFVTAGKASGTGLGLAIVKKIVEEHGGAIAVVSNTSGTTFTISLPQQEPKT